jgi:hypothetical protein
VERSEVARGLWVCQFGFRGAGTGAGGIGVDVNVGVQGGIQLSDAGKVGVDEFYGRDFFRADGGGLFD